MLAMSARLMLVAILISFCLLPFPVLADESLGKGWHLVQKSCTIGTIDLFVGRDAVKLSCSKLGLTLVTRAPKWDVAAYNATTKKFMELSKPDLEKVFGGARKPVAPVDGKHSESDSQIYQLISSDKTICGMRTLEYRIPSKYSIIGKEVASKHLDEFVTQDLVKSNAAIHSNYVPPKWHVGDEDTWVAAQIDFPEAAVRKFGFKALKGAHPFLRTIHVGEDGSHAMAWDTVQCQQMPLTAAMFEIPKGFARTENQISLMVQDEDMDVLAGPHEGHTIKLNQDARAVRPATPPTR